MTTRNISLLGATYSDVPAVTLPVSGGGTATFTEVTDTTATASDVASGKYFYTANGTKTQGTASGGYDFPTFMIEFHKQGEYWDADVDNIELITCDKTFAECEQMYSDWIGTAIVTDATGDDQPIIAEAACIDSHRYSDLTYIVTMGGVPWADIIYYSNGDIVAQQPSIKRDSTDLTVSGATVTAQSGYYPEDASKSVASGTAGTPVATKGTVSNHSVTVTPSATNTTGYITGGTKTGTAVTVTASELISFSTYYTGSSAPSSSLGSDGDIYLQTT